MRPGLVLLVFVGGGVGSVARYLLATTVQRNAPEGFPFGTFLVNLIGCFAIGVVGALGLERAALSPGRPLCGRLGRVGSARDGARPGDREGRRMKDVATAKLLRIHIGEADRLRNRPLFEALVLEAREAGLAGATVLRGVESYGASSVVHRARLVELSEDLPVVVEIVDTEEKVRGFLERIDPLLTEAGCGVLMTLEKVEIVRYAARAKR